jgi:DNA replication protein DnaC
METVAGRKEPYQKAGAVVDRFLAELPGKAAPDPEREAQIAAQLQEQEAEECAARWKKVVTTMGERFQDASFENYVVYDEKQRKVVSLVKSYVARIEKIMEKGTGVIMAGRPGTGKDHLVAAVCRELVAKGIEPTVARFYEVTEAGMPRDGQRTSWVKVAEQHARARFLVLSEIGIQAKSVFEGRVLYHILDERYKHLRPFILTTNLSVAELKDVLDPDGSGRVWDRMKEVAHIIPFTWESYRQRGVVK